MSRAHSAQARLAVDVACALFEPFVVVKAPWYELAKPRHVLFPAGPDTTLQAFDVASSNA